MSASGAWSSFSAPPNPPVGLPTAPKMTLLVASAVLQAITIWPAAFAAAIGGQSPVGDPAPTTPGADHAGAPAARVANRIVWVPEPQPGPAHCVHTTIALPVGSIDA